MYYSWFIQSYPALIQKGFGDTHTRRNARQFPSGQMHSQSLTLLGPRCSPGPYWDSGASAVFSPSRVRSHTPFSFPFLGGCLRGPGPERYSKETGGIQKPREHVLRPSARLSDPVSSLVFSLLPSDTEGVSSPRRGRRKEEKGWTPSPSSTGGREHMADL